MHMIHDAPGYQLGARTSNDPISGTTVELFAKHPRAKRPRWQRIVCLTLPVESLRSLSEVFADASALPRGRYDL